jgi:hypothetical protein
MFALAFIEFGVTVAGGRGGPGGLVAAIAQGAQHGVGFTDKAIYQ